MEPTPAELAERRAAQAAREAFEASARAARAERMARLCLVVAVLSMACTGGLGAAVLSRDDHPMQGAGALVADTLTVRSIELVDENAETRGLLRANQAGASLVMWSDGELLHRAEVTVQAVAGMGGFVVHGDDHRRRAALEVSGGRGDLGRPVLELKAFDREEGVTIGPAGPGDARTRGYFGLR
jgi:hypothetical protein